MCHSHGAGLALAIADAKIETILTEAGMAKVGHRKRFVYYVQKLRAAAA